MKTIADAFAAYKAGTAILYDDRETEAIALLAISGITDLSKAKIKAFPELELTPQQTRKLQEVLDKLKTGEPIQYILGKTEFYGLNFEVNQSVLIPRPETEELVEWIITTITGSRLRSDHVPLEQSVNILDIGTGSGCIAISLQKNLSGRTVFAVDVSEEALKTAQNNAALNQVAFKGLQADILNLTTGAVNETLLLNTKFTTIVSNPPYVTQEDKNKMHKNVVDFEPHTALFVPDDDPLIFYKAMADFACKTLIKNGLLFFEINESFGQQTVDLLADKGFVNIELRKDMSGKDRMVKAEIGLLVH
jgi:release factor glutamine methyltransferase